MELYNTISNRYSYRGEYTNKQVSREQLKRIVQAGLDAPSGKNLQTTQFIIIDDKKIIEKIKSILPDKKTIQTCSAIIACLVDSNPVSSYHGNHFQIEDCAASVENMLLAITAEGLASVWLDGVLRINGVAENLHKVLELSNSKKVQVLLPIGFPKEEGTRREKKKFEDRVCFNKYTLM